MNDAEEFDITLNAMRSVGMGGSQIQAILSLVGAVLHLGNLEFRPKQVGGAEGSTLSSRVDTCWSSHTSYDTNFSLPLIHSHRSLCSGFAS